MKSSFNGRITEIPGIRVDNFENPSTNGTKAYFLSHFHSDHTVGLGAPEFLQELNEKKNVFIYASKLCCEIIKYNYGCLKEYVKTLDLGSNLITLWGKDGTETYVNVTLIPAGHCLGSTMFLFETINTKVLYTGDFRIRDNDVPKYTSLHCNGEIVKLDALYVDTTFIEMDYMDFPKRSDTALDAVRIISDWLKDNSVYIVLKTSANYAYEHVFNMIYKELKMKVYVDDKKWAFYSTIQNLVPSVTNNSTETRVFLNYTPKATNIRRLHFSAMAWTKWTNDSLCIRNEKNSTRICFSTHCSRSELISFVDYLKPARVVGFPNPYVVGSGVTLGPTESPRKAVKRCVDGEPRAKDEKVDRALLKKLFG